jgi:hypothetical protein
MQHGGPPEKRRPAGVRGGGRRPRPDVVVGRGAADLSVGSDSAGAAVPGPLADRPRFSRPDNRVEEAGAGGDEPRAMGATGDRPGEGTRHAARQAPGTAAGAARGAAGSGNSDTDVTAHQQRWSTPGTTQLAPAAEAGNRAITGLASADTRCWTTAVETHVDGTFAGASSGEPRGLDTTVGKPGAGAQSAARPAPGTAAGAARGTPGSENSDKDVVSDKQRGNKLGTTQLVLAATVPRNAEQQLEPAPEDAPEAAPRLNVPHLEDKWTAFNRLLPAHAYGTFDAAGAPACGTLLKQKPERAGLLWREPVHSSCLCARAT